MVKPEALKHELERLFNLSMAAGGFPTLHNGEKYTLTLTIFDDPMGKKYGLKSGETLMRDGTTIGQSDCRELVEGDDGEASP